MIHMLSMGITSFMTGTEALDLHAACVHAYLRGEHSKAQELFYTQIMPYFAFYECYPDELLKKMLHWRGIIQNNIVIPPHVPRHMSNAEWRLFEGVLNKLEWRTDWSDILAQSVPQTVANS